VDLRGDTRPRGIEELVDAGFVEQIEQSVEAFIERELEFVGIERNDREEADRPPVMCGQFPLLFRPAERNGDGERAKLGARIERFGRLFSRQGVSDPEPAIVEVRKARSKFQDFDRPGFSVSRELLQIGSEPVCRKTDDEFRPLAG
jgi:hypothetical protein